MTSNFPIWFQSCGLNHKICPKGRTLAPINPEIRGGQGQVMPLLTSTSLIHAYSYRPSCQAPGDMIYSPPLVQALQVTPSMDFGGSF